MGELVVDLRDSDLPSGDVALQLDLGVGEARLLVPEDVCVAAVAEIGMGNVSFFDRDNGGIDLDFDERPDAEGDSTRILLDAQIGMGELRVGHEDTRYYRGDSTGFYTGGNAACATTGQSASG